MKIKCYVTIFVTTSYHFSYQCFNFKILKFHNRNIAIKTSTSKFPIEIKLLEDAPEVTGSERKTLAVRQGPLIFNILRDTEFSSMSQSLININLLGIEKSFSGFRSFLMQFVSGLKFRLF